jgi:hypothetical protein
VDENGKPTSASYQISANVTVQNWNANQVRDTDIRFVQFCQIKKWRAVYAGKKSSDGMLQLDVRGSLLNLFLDCLTNGSATAARNFPYYHGETTSKTATAYFPMMEDTPGARLEGDIYNGRSQRNNYLWKFENEAKFTSMLVAVNKDGSREPLEAWEWSLKRKLVLTWMQGNPHVVTQQSDLKAESQPTTLQGDIRRAIAIRPDGVSVVNIEFNKAILNYRSTPDIFYFERYDYDGDESPPTDFWT